MTVSTTTSRADYTGNGTTTAFAVPFYFLDDSHLTVLRTQISTGVITTLAITTNYTVSGAGNPAGGTVTCVVAPTTDQKISILRNVPLTQLNTYVPNDPFPAASHERALDKLTMEAQQLDEALDRALTLPPNTPAGTVSTELPTPQANRFIGWNGTATGLQNLDASTLATITAYGNRFIDVFSGNGVQTQFTLSQNPGTINNLSVSISGVTQRPIIDYTHPGGAVISFVSPPASGTNNIMVQYGSVVSTGAPSRDAQTFDTVAIAGSATIDAAVNHIRTAGYYAAGDGGGALYKRVGSAPAHGAFITSNSGTVFWELSEAVPSVLQTGARGDGTTDDSAAFNTALAFSTNVYAPDTTNGYRINSGVTLNTRNSLFGDEHRTRIIHGGSTNCFTVAGNEVSISGFFVDATNNTAGNTFFINTTASRERILIRNIYTIYGNGLLADSNSTGIIVTLKLQDVQARFHEGRGVHLRDAFAFIEFQNVLVDYLNLASPTNQTAYEIVNVEGVSFINVEATGSYQTIAGTTTAQRGFVFTSSKAIYLYRTFADNLGGIGYDFTTCDYVRMDNVTASQCDNYGIRLAGTTNFVSSNVYVGGRSPLVTKTASIDGIFITSSSQHVVFTALQVRSCTGNGVVNNGCANVVISGGELLANTGRGLVCSGAGTVTLVTGVQFVSNTAGDYTLLTANDIVTASQINSGAVIHAGLGSTDSPTFANVVVGNGTAAAPSMRGADVDSGIFHGTDFVGLTAGGNEIVRANAAGLSLNTGRSFGFKTASVNFTASLQTGATDGMIWNSDSSASYFRYQVNSTTRLELNNTGIGFFAATPVAQPNTTGTATGFTAGTGTAVNDASTFTGGVGTRAYRISDIVKALKDLGLIASS